MSAQAAINFARAHVGVHEIGTTNRSPVIDPWQRACGFIGGPWCAAFVHHGGIGSSAQACASGVRQLVTPFAHDQPDNAFRLKNLGIAEVIPSTKYRVERIVPALRRLFDSPDVARACREVKSRFDGIDALDRTCELIEQLRPAAPSTPAALARTA